MSERPEDAWLIALGTDVSDGKPVDWSRAEGRATTDEARTIVENLRHLESVIQANRTTATDVAGSTGPASNHWHHLVILERIGSGAFGSVYRAWDTTLEREVALKLVPIDPRRARSPVDEARHLARVPHPNIVRVYGVEQDADEVGIWMEYIQGETLSAMVRDRGPMSAREVVGIGVDLCRALSAMQSASLLHRDIKAQNVMREIGGRIVLMDFSGAWGVIRGEMPSTMSGTPLYMAPELFEGQPPTIATDIYSLGVLLFYLLSGETPVAAGSIDDVKSAHASGARTRLRDFRPELPEAVVQVVERATSPKAGERYQTAGELEHALIGTQGAPTTDASPERRRVPWRWTAMAALATVVLAAGAFTLGRLGAAPVARAPLVHLPLGPPDNTKSWPRISPNGRMVVYGTVFEGRETMWVRPLNSTDGHPLAHVSARESTFWSPDSRHLAFFDAGKLKRVAFGDNVQPQTLTDASLPRGGDWGSSGVIVFSDASGIVRINADGTGRAAATTLDLARGEYAHQWPEFLPDGRHFVFVVRSSQPEHAGVYLASLDSLSRRRLMPAYSRAVYAAPGYLLFAKDGALLAQPFDLDSLQLSGAATPVAPRVKHHEASDTAFDVSDNGVLVYREPEALPVTRLLLRDRGGDVSSPLTPVGTYRHPRFSPNGQRVVVERFVSEGLEPDIWLYDRERMMSSPFVTNQGLDIAPAWSPDGRHIAFSSRRGSRYDVYTKTVDEVTPEKLVIEQDGDTIVEDWAPRGLGLLTSVFGKGLLLTQSGPPRSSTATHPSSLSGRWLSEMSDDGKWIAYTSFEGKTSEVYIEPVEKTGSRWQASARGGVEPHWRADGRELFYLTLDGFVASVDVTLEGSDLRTGQSKTLFRANTPEFLGTSNFDVTRDGQTFIVNTLIAYPHVPPVRVMVNWTTALDR